MFCLLFCIVQEFIETSIVTSPLYEDDEDNDDNDAELNNRVVDIPVRTLLGNQHHSLTYVVFNFHTRR